VTDTAARRAGLDAAALKPTEVDLRAAATLPADLGLVVDDEGREHRPKAATLRGLTADHDVRITTPVRSDGYDPLGDDSTLDAVPDGVGRVAVAGNPNYMTDQEAARDIAVRLRAAREADPDAWVGTEHVERIAMTVGGTQFELFTPSTEREIRALRAAGFADPVAVYVPVVLSEDDDVRLDAVGEYTARRRPVARALPDDTPTDASAAGRAREVLTRAVRDYAFVGSVVSVRERTDALRAAGVDTVVGYPAAGIEDLR
jgi:hypothetical protein